MYIDHSYIKNEHHKMRIMENKILNISQTINDCIKQVLEYTSQDHRMEITKCRIHIHNRHLLIKLTRLSNIRHSIFNIQNNTCIFPV